MALRTAQRWKERRSSSNHPKGFSLQAPHHNLSKWNHYLNIPAWGTRSLLLIFSPPTPTHTQKGPSPFSLLLELYFGDVKRRWKMEGDRCCEIADCGNEEEVGQRGEEVDVWGEEEPAGTKVSEMEEMFARECAWRGSLLILPGKAQIWFACHNKCFSLPKGKAALHLQWLIWKFLFMYYLTIICLHTRTDTPTGVLQKERVKNWGGK